MSRNEEIGKVLDLVIQRRKRCREEDIPLPDNSESSELKSLDRIVEDPLRGTPPQIVDEGIDVSDWVESQMRNISESRVLVHARIDEECSLGKQAAPSEFVSKMPYEEALRRLEELQKSIEEDEVKLKPLQEQSDQCFNRLMNNEENWKHYIEWRKRNGLEVPKDLSNANSLHQPSILLPSGKSAFSPTASILETLQVDEPILASTMDRITPITEMVVYADDLSSETDTVTKFAV